jgi:hypothetical protein
MGWRTWFALGVAVLSGVALAVGCLPTNGLSGGEARTPVADGSTGENIPDADAAFDEEASDAGTDADASLGPNLVVNGDFEFGCASWSARSATLSESTIARSGASSCLFCRIEGAPDGYMSQKLEADVAPGDKFAAEIWVRAFGDAGVPVTTRARLDVVDSKGSGQQGPSTAGPTLTTTWQRIPAIVEARDAGVKLYFELMTLNGAPCVLVDDAVITRKN